MSSSGHDLSLLFMLNFFNDYCLYGTGWGIGLNAAGDRKIKPLVNVI